MELLDIVRQRARDNPSGILVQCREAALTNADGWAFLQSLKTQFGHVRGRRAVLLLPDSLETYLLYLLWFLEGGVLVPVPIQAAGERLRHICERVGPDLVLTNEYFLPAHGALLTGYRCLAIPPLAEGRELRRPYEISKGAEKAPLFPEGRDDHDEPVRQIIFTSGSTGVPKGVCLGERSLLSAAAMMVEFLPLDHSTRSMVTVPLYDYYGMIQIFGHLLGGGSYAFGFQTALADQFLGALKELCSTDLVTVPFTLRKLLKAKDASKRAGFGHLRRITSSSDTLTDDLLAGVFALQPEILVVNIYGLTEIGRACYRKISQDTPPSRSIGRPSPGVRLVVNGDAQNPGEIVMSGPNLMLGYLTGVTSAGLSFNPCSEMNTGDLGYLDEAGELVLVGRRDHVFNLMGMKIHPTEIETRAMLLPGVTEVRAQLRQAQGGDGYIHLDVVRSDPGLRSELIVDHLRKDLARPFVPRTVNFVASLGRTDVGEKLLRR
jgi:acyl-CoA synthetase (AMP-forming)/AMP-acid ligase II